MFPRTHAALMILALGYGTCRGAEATAAAGDRPIGADFSAFQDPSAWYMAADAAIDPARAEGLAAKDGAGVMVNGKEGRTKNILTRKEYGDVEVHVEFVVPKGSNSGVYFQGRYEIQVLDSWDSAAGKPKEHPEYSDCGGIYHRWDEARGAGKEGFEGHPPRVNAARRPGEWQSFDVVFRAPRFDAAGKKIENARFVSVVHNGILVHANVEVTGPTRAATFNDEKPEGPIMLQGDHGPVAYREIVIRPMVAGALASGFPRETFDERGFTAIFDGKSLDGWHVSAKTGHSAKSGNKTGGRWVVEDGAITGSQDIPENGGIIITDRKFGDFEVAAEMKNDFGPDSGFFLRSTENGACYQYLVDYHNDGNLAGLYGEGLNPGFHVRNFSFIDDPEKIKEENDKAPFPLPVSAADWPRFWKHGQWNELRARIEGNPPKIVTWINGVRFMEWQDTQKRLGDEGGIAFQVHGGNIGSVNQFVRYRNVRIKDLKPAAKASAALEEKGGGASTADAPYKLVAPLDVIMEKVDDIFGGFAKKFGEKGEAVTRTEFKSLKKDALFLSEMFNVVHASKKERDFGEWTAQNRDQFIALAAACEKGDTKTCKELVERIDKTCTACHEKYRDKDSEK